MPLGVRPGGMRASLRRVFALQHLARVAAIGDQPIETRLPSAIAVARQEWRGRGATHCGAKFLRREPTREPTRAFAAAFGGEGAGRRQFPALALINFEQLRGRTFGRILGRRNLRRPRSGADLFAEVRRSHRLLFAPVLDALRRQTHLLFQILLRIQTQIPVLSLSFLKAMLEPARLSIARLGIARARAGSQNDAFFTSAKARAIRRQRLRRDRRR